MQEKNPPDYHQEYPCHLGRLLGNLASLQMMIRVVLYALATPQDQRRRGGFWSTLGACNRIKAL
jgi:hypothetical protein